jgi:hypothetical protein
MYTLKNDTLKVAILDPVGDRKRLGTRYCTGGYIFQITDVDHGDLLAGPTYPDAFNTFDGQGIPDAFNLNPLRMPTLPRRHMDPDAAQPEAGQALILGIGVCDMVEDRVEDWCTWQVEATPESVRMITYHSYLKFDIELERTVRLLGRTVRSETTVRNNGWPMAIRWFPHPFFPQPETAELCKFNVAVSFPENPGYELGPNGFVQRRAFPERRGFYQALDHDGRTNLVVLQKHPKVGLVAATCSYAPSFFPIWGNANTFSWEPFFERSLAPQQAVSWSIDYDF